MFWKNKQSPKSNTVQDNQYQYFKLKVDFYERSNRILHTYMGDKNSIMKMYAELLSRILNYPVSIIFYDGPKLVGASFRYIEEYCENLINIKPFMLVTSQNYPVMTFPSGFLVWHNPNYILSLDEDLLYTAVSQISLAEESLQLIDSLKDFNIDPLTGLYSRRHLLECLDIEISRSKRHNLSFGFMIFQINDYKAYSDAYGHKEADKALKDMAVALQENFRKEDIKARYSEDKLCVVVPQYNKELKKLAQKTQSLIECRLKPPIVKRPITTSVGGALYPESATNVDNLIQIADDRLYRSKQEIVSAGV